MFWIAIFGFVFLAVDQTRRFVRDRRHLTTAIKLLLIAILVGSIAAAWFWLRKKTSGTADKQ